VGWFSSTIHSISKVIDQGAKPVGNLFNSNTALVRALANPGDVIAVGQAFDNAVVKRQTPRDQLSDADATVSSVVHQVGDAHQQLWYRIEDGASWVYHGVIEIWHSIWFNVRNLWRQVGGEKHFNQLGSTIHHTVNKWGGERRVVAWAVVVVVVIVVVIIEIVTWGAATPVIGPGGWALIMALLSFGVQQGLTPDAQPLSLFAEGSPLTNNNDYNSISNSNSSSSSGQSGSFLDQLANALGNLPPAMLIGAAAVGTLGVFYMLSRR
jgi:hypothetical protein